MAWLRLDDGFTSHPKIAALNDREYRVWTRLLVYCARYRTEGKLPANALVEIPQLTSPMLRKFRELRLLDPGDIVHDWKMYNAETVAEKVAAYLEEHPDATANEVYRVVGGNRNIVLAEIARQRGQGGTQPVSESVPKPVSQAVSERYQSGIRAGAPVPSSTPERSTTAAGPRNEGPAAAPAAADPDLQHRLAELDFGPDETTAALAEPTRAWAWIHHAEHHATESVGGYAWANFQRGGWPAETPDDEKPKRPLVDVARDLINRFATEYPDDALLDELGILERKRDETLTDQQRAQLLELAHERRQETAAA